MEPDLPENISRPGRYADRSGRVRILVLRTGALGDFVLTLPVLEELRRSLPHAEVVLMARAGFGRLARAAGLAGEIISEDGPPVVPLYSHSADAGRELRESLGAFEIALSFVQSPQVGRNLLAAGVGELHCRAPRPHPSTGLHAADHLLAILRGLGRVRTPATPHLALGEEDRARAERALGERGVTAGEYLALHPGSGSPGKNWPLDRFVEAARRARGELGLRTVVLAGPAESEGERRGEIEGAFRGVADAFLWGADLVTLAGVLAMSAAYVGNDSGVTHLAAAAGAKVVAVFGPTDPAVWGPRSSLHGGSERVRVVRRSRVHGVVPTTRHESCKPEDVNVEEVLGELRALIG